LIPNTHQSPQSWITTSIPEKFEFQQQFDCKELIIGGSWAFMRGIEINRLTPRDGGEIVLRKQRAFSVLRREADGTWLFARGMTNLPPPEKTVE
jgi:ketosteroid isomerase-like protein